MNRRARALVVGLTMLALLVGAANAAAAKPRTLTVDDNRQDCPKAKFTSLQKAVDEAKRDDVVAVCAGTYVVGDKERGLVIDEDVTIRGAGADRVTIVPRGGDKFVPEGATLRDGKGAIVLVKGSPDHPTTAGISGVTVDANGVYALAGVVFLDAQGSLDRSHVTGLAIDGARTATPSRAASARTTTASGSRRSRARTSRRRRRATRCGRSRSTTRGSTATTPSACWWTPRRTTTSPATPPPRR